MISLVDADSPNSTDCEQRADCRVHIDRTSPPVPTQRSPGLLTTAVPLKLVKTEKMQPAAAAADDDEKDVLTKSEKGQDSKDNHGNDSDSGSSNKQGTVPLDYHNCGLVVR